MNVLAGTALGCAVLLTSCSARSSATGSAAARIDAAIAQALITAFQREALPRLAPEAQFPVRETTTDEVWQALRIQVFQVTGEIALSESFVIRENRVIPIGRAFGGNGITSMCVSDVDGNGHADLVYSYRWGSGILRTNVAWLDLDANPPIENELPEACSSPVDVRIEPGDHDTVQVTIDGAYAGRIVRRIENGVFTAHLELLPENRDVTAEDLRKH